MICLIAGTNRPNSQTLRVTKILDQSYQKHGAKTRILDLNQLPPEIFTPEAYDKKPAAFENFSKAVLDADGLVIVTPEYNGGFPGVLKYFIDMLKFPESFEKKPVAFVGLAAGMWGALRPVEQLTQIFLYRNAFVFNERVFLPRVESALTPDGGFKETLVRDLVESQTKNFIGFCQRVRQA